ncbi:YybH family protein [Acidovorax sp. NCPPB 3576]|uniref:YybH family protein n=1 Tax=Acidovorax sp. NCPPB 3576 TaxID=2940488 RepID=UPI002349B45D|nr:nuclear transport factor 2 family protein [Acidovorax sp. NCPPB 3576]WCM87971.1 nuclear transport factor 2 family protein [Acidovorax sp. NCPPB 3576]
MTRSPYRAANLGGSADETEAAFYEALQTGNLERLMACWAEEDDIVCVNPGGPRLLGAAAIRAAFSAMFEHGTLRARPAQVHRVQAMASAVHSVVEHVEVVLDGGVREAIVHSTNVYHKTPLGWRLVAHHASPGTLHESQAPGQPPPVLH